MKPKKSTSPKKAAEPTVDLLGLDGPAQAPVTNGSAVVGPALNDDLDIFGPMISNPLPATVMPPAQVLCESVLLQDRCVFPFLKVSTDYSSKPEVHMANDNDICPRKERAQ